MKEQKWHGVQRRATPHEPASVFSPRISLFYVFYWTDVTHSYMLYEDKGYLLG